MVKLKSGNCPICHKSLQRHDPNRTIIRVAKRVLKEVHLSCYQKEMEVKGGL